MHLCTANASDILDLAYLYELRQSPLDGSVDYTTWHLPVSETLPQN